MLKLNDLLDVFSETQKFKIYGDDLDDCLYDGAILCNDLNDIRKADHCVCELSASDTGEIIIIVE